MAKLFKNVTHYVKLMHSSKILTNKTLLSFSFSAPAAFKIFVIHFGSM